MTIGEGAGAAAASAAAVLGKCITRYVQIASRRPRFLSHQMEPGQSTAGIATRNTSHRDTKIAT